MQTAASQTAKKYRVTLDGNYAHFDTVAEIQAWGDDLVRRFGWLVGKSMHVSKLTGIDWDGMAWYAPARSILVEG